MLVPQAAVAAKGFKDAAQLSQEIKELAAKRDALLEAKEGLDAEVLASKQELERCNTQVQVGPNLLPPTSWETFRSISGSLPRQKASALES